MAKVGRNDPCPCGSGKKYKHCHLLIEEAQRAEQLHLKRATDSLAMKIHGQVELLTSELGTAMARYWAGRYTPEQLAELEALEDSADERFLAWLAFDYQLEDGRTLVERLIIDPSDLDLNEYEARLLPNWGSARLRPYMVQKIRKGHGMHLRSLGDNQEYELEDHNASRALVPGEILIAHLVPAAGQWYIGGAAAHLTADTAAPLLEYLDIYRAHASTETSELSWDDFFRRQSEVVNHFVMRLPTDKPEPGLFERLIAEAREQTGAMID